MKISITLSFALSLLLSVCVFSQDTQTPVLDSQLPDVKGYLVGPGDKLEGKVLGEPDFDFTAIIDDTGSFKLPYVDDPVTAKCRTESDIRTDVKNLLSKYLKDPLVSVQVTERRTPVPVTIIGEVRNPQKVDLRRSATLVELLVFAGGIKEESANGTVKVYRTQPPMCGDENSKNNWVAAANSVSGLPFRSFNTDGVSESQDQSNPEIFPGDLIIVEKAPPVYVIGEVNALRSISITEGGLTLSEAIAQAGGFRDRAKKKDIIIRRLKPDSKEREIIQVNFNLIADGTQKDVMLKAEDIVIVDKAPKSIGETILEIATGSIRNAANILPQTVLF